MDVILNFYVMEKIVSLLEVFFDYACLAIFCAAVFFFLLLLAVKLRILSFLVFIVLGIVHMVIIAIGRFLLFVVDKGDARAMKIFEKRIGNSGLKEEMCIRDRVRLAFLCGAFFYDQRIVPFFQRSRYDR